jgi:hypothetical protein
VVIQSTRRRILGLVIAAFVVWALAVGTVQAQHMSTCDAMEKYSWEWYFFGCWIIGALHALLNPSVPMLLVR